MSRDVPTVAPTDTVRVVAERIVAQDGRDGLPVVEDRTVEGIVTAHDLLLADETARVFTVMSEDVLVAQPDMSIDDAGRVIFRTGVGRLPVVDDANRLVGMVTNADVIRSQIERATPEKVGKLVRTLERIHGVDVERERDTVALADLTPTQRRVYADELRGRRYELDRGLAEPVVVVDAGGDRYLADGHHRLLAADRTGVEEMDAYVLRVPDDVDLGMAETAAEAGLETVDDVEVVEGDRHPLVATTRRLQDG